MIDKTLSHKVHYVIFELGIFIQFMVMSVGKRKI